jgi:hypothetical protein
MKKIEISEETLRGLFLILCGASYDHTGAEVYPEAISIMNAAHKEIIKMGKEKGFDDHGSELHNFKP